MDIGKQTWVLSLGAVLELTDGCVKALSSRGDLW